MLKYHTEKIIEVQDWDALVEETYKRPYSFQQQDGCKERGTHQITIPEEGEDFENDSVPEKVNGNKMGVSFKAWLERAPTLDVFKDTYSNGLFWERNFYPNVQVVANDLHAKGLIEAGNYIINIDW